MLMLKLCEPISLSRSELRDWLTRLLLIADSVAMELFAALWQRETGKGRYMGAYWEPLGSEARIQSAGHCPMSIVFLAV